MASKTCDGCQASVKTDDGFNNFDGKFYCKECWNEDGDSCCSGCSECEDSTQHTCVICEQDASCGNFNEEHEFVCEACESEAATEEAE